jgi:hypothetical protein
MCRAGVGPGGVGPGGSARAVRGWPGAARSARWVVTVPSVKVQRTSAGWVDLRRPARSTIKPRAGHGPARSTGRYPHADFRETQSDPVERQRFVVMSPYG